VRTTPGKGRGVFATRRFRRGDVMERSPVIPLAEKDWPRIEKTALGVYPYDWSHGREGFCIVLGLGSLYNHSYRPNAVNVPVPGDLAMHWVALRDIARGEEITVNYNAEDDPDDPLWFRVRG
jgi:SET domain-containing protein